MRTRLVGAMHLELEPPVGVVARHGQPGEPRAVVGQQRRLRMSREELVARGLPELVAGRRVVHAQLAHARVEPEDAPAPVGELERADGVGHARGVPLAGPRLGGSRRVERPAGRELLQPHAPPLPERPRRDTRRRGRAARRARAAGRGTACGRRAARETAMRWSHRSKIASGPVMAPPPSRSMRTPGRAGRRDSSTSTCSSPAGKRRNASARSRCRPSGHVGRAGRPARAT